MQRKYGVGLAVVGVALLSWQACAIGAAKVVVVPLGNGAAVGNATTADVVAGKTFSNSKQKGLMGTLNLPPTMKTHTTPVYGMIFNLIPAGSFMMGSPASEPGGPYVDETQHQVILTKPFYMQTTEITQQQWRDVILDAEAAGHLAIGVLDETPSWSHDNAFMPDYPVENVTWENARDWINALNQLTNKKYSLPTEAQWEYAARATTTTAWAYLYDFDNGADGSVTGTDFNSNLTSMGWYAHNNTTDYDPGSVLVSYDTKPVAKKQPNKWGLYDMHGNVMEWCRDWASATYYSEPDATVDPQGPATGVDHIARGGCCYSSAGEARSADRMYGVYILPPGGACGHGFRLVMPVNQ